MPIWKAMGLDLTKWVKKKAGGEFAHKGERVFHFFKKKPLADPCGGVYLRVKILILGWFVLLGLFFF